MMPAMLLFENGKNGARPTQSSGELTLVLCKRVLNFCCNIFFSFWQRDLKRLPGILFPFVN